MEKEISIINQSEKLLRGKLQWKESLEFIDQVLSSDTDLSIFETMLSLWLLYHSGDESDNRFLSTLFHHD